MICPICQKRKATRFCPAKSESICSVDCATEREVTIDCPSDCPHLIASRQYEADRGDQVDVSKVPFGEIRITPDTFRNHGPVLDAIALGLCEFAADHRELVDSDTIAALRNLAESYQTLANGIYYEKPLDYRLQHELSAYLKQKIADYKKEEASRSNLSPLHDETVRDALIFFTQVGAMRTNGRPKGRAFLDFLRREFKWQDTRQGTGSGLVILP